MRRGDLWQSLIDWRFIAALVTAGALTLVGVLAYSNAVNERRALQAAQAATTAANGTALRTVRRVDQLQATIDALNAEVAALAAAKTPTDVQQALAAANTRLQSIEAQTATRPITAPASPAPPPPSTTSTTAPRHAPPPTTTTTQPPVLCVNQVCVTRK